MKKQKSPRSHENYNMADSNPPATMKNTISQPAPTNVAARDQGTGTASA